MTIPMPPIETEQDRIAKLEKEYRNLLTRIERLEKQRGSWIPGLLGSVLLLVMAGLMVDYLGFFPSAVERLPLKATAVEADEFVLRGPNGKVWGKLHVAGQEVTLTRYDSAGKPSDETISSKPGSAQPERKER
jgi:hypothetical protein